MLSSTLLTLALATSAIASPLSKRQNDTTSTGACAGNTADTRTEWCDLDINTDWYNVVPDTGVTREYWFELTDGEVSPDGRTRYAQMINGSIPGPLITADWGDEVVVHVTNSLTESTNGTSLHFHGIRQNYTNQNDGVASITQCPGAPGSTQTYRWRATQYGSTWYHSHYAMQAWQGVFGPILINGPASANYDVDLGHIMLNDWDSQTVDDLLETASSRGPPSLDNCLINGTMVFGEDDSASQTGSRFTANFEAGTSYRIRLVNGAIDTHFKFSIDNHTLTVIASDLVPITPYETTTLSIGIGQRYDVIVTADQSDVASDFWLRATPQDACSDISSRDNIKGIIHYGDSTGTPTTSEYSYTDSCEDETDLVPIVSKTVGDAIYTALENAATGINSDGLFKWTLNSTTFVADTENPTLMQINNGITEFTDSNAVLEYPDANQWAYLIIQTTMNVPHPIHLHGFDFFVIAQGSGTYSEGTTTLNLENPPRRDTAMLPARGHVVLAFETDNPGAWLMHCHIGWHTSEGFALQYIVQRDAIVSNNLIDSDVLTDTCSAWSSHMDSVGLEITDSGI